MRKGIKQLALISLTASILSGSLSAPVWAKKAAKLAGTVAFVDLDNSTDTVNIRASADSLEGEVVGVMKNHDSMIIKKVTADGWYKISSGDVKGYVAGYLIATGDKADEIAKETAYNYIIVKSDKQGVFSSMDPSSALVDVLSKGDQAEMVQDNGDWLKLCLSKDSFGYIPSSAVEKKVAYPTAKTIKQFEEEAEAAYAAAVAYDEGRQEGPDAAAENSGGNSAGNGPENSAGNGSEQSSGQYATAEYRQDEKQYSESSGSSTPTYSSEQVYYADSSSDGQSFEPVYAKETDGAAVDTYTSGSQESFVDNVAGQGSDGSTVGYDSSYFANDASSSDSSYTYTDSSQSGGDFVDAVAGQGCNSGSVESFEGDYLLSADASAQTNVSSQESGNGTVDYYSEDWNASASQDQNQNYGTENSTGTVSTDTGSTDAGSTGDAAASAEEGAVAPAASELGVSVAVYAQQFVGNPYVWGGSSLTEGADCSGFTMAVFAAHGVTLPHNAESQYSCGTAVSLDSLAPGDLVFFNSTGSIDHVAIYIGNNQMVHAANSKSGIIISDLNWMTPVAACRVV